MKKCAYCGREADDESAVCLGCGKEFGAAPEVGADSPLADPALNLVKVANFASVTEAQFLVSRLEAAGIEAVVPEEYSSQVFPVIPLVMVTVRVAAKDYEKAREIVAETPDDSAPQGGK